MFQRNQTPITPPEGTQPIRGRWKTFIRNWLAGRPTLWEGIGTSLFLHLALLIVLATIVVQHRSSTAPLEIITIVRDTKPDFVVETPQIPPLLAPGETTARESPLLVRTEALQTGPVEFPHIGIELPPSDRLPVDLGTPSFAANLDGRSTANRQALLAAFGGTAQSEAAVALGLQWLVKHQQSDGSWSFNHIHGKECERDCTEPGSLGRQRMGATGMALLCFLGAGQTHREGVYANNIDRGFRYLLDHAVIEGTSADMRDVNPGNSGMYSHGLCTIALCEATAMTRDPEFRRAAQFAVNFVVKAQHPEDGGWRYQVPDRGDTSVVGWQVMALSSARMAKLSVPRTTFTKVRQFLNRVAIGGRDGAYYGYTRPSRKPSTTAVGLLSRIYLGWERTHPGLDDGTEFLANLGPQIDDMYFNYYATQVLHHWGGPRWNEWNTRMRDMLIQLQSRQGHATGSWAPRDPHASSGGRLYMTCLAVMTLEVYYRHLPLYRPVMDEGG